MDNLQYITGINSIDQFFSKLVKSYTKNFVTFLFCTYLMLKGFLCSSVSLSLLPFYKKTLNVNETTYQIYLLIIWTPWCIKAAVGSISDLYPLLGYNKKYYMFFTSIASSIALFLLFVFPFVGSLRIIAPFLMFIIMVQISTVDLLCESEYAKRMKTQSKELSGNIVSFVWGCVVFGSFLASAFVGVFTDHFNAKYVYLIILPFSLQILIPIYKNYMGETQIPKEEIKFNHEKLKSNQEIFYLGFAMAFFALGTAFMNLFFKPTYVMMYAVIVSTILCIFSFKSQEVRKAKCNIYLFLIEATYIQIPGAMDYWYTADSSCVKGGPHFDMTYYLTYTNMLGSAAGIVGILIYNAKMSKWRFRNAFLVSSFMRIFASLFDIFIVSRTNLRLGISDKAAYLFGDALVMNTASMLASMPAVTLTASIVNDGLESTTYAILAGFQNFGNSVSKSIGVALMNYFGIDADSRPCNFHNLPLLIFICHFVAPLIPVFLVHFMIDESSKETKYGVLDDVAVVEEDISKKLESISVDIRS